MGVYRGRDRKTRVWLGGAIVWFSYNHINPPGVHWVHGGPGGRPLLKSDVSWRNICGFLVRTPNSQTFIHWRRFPRYVKSSDR